MRLRNLILFRWIDYTSTTGETESHHVPELRGHRVWTTGFEFIRGHKQKTRWQLEEEGWARSASCQLHRTVSDHRNWTARRKQGACIFICICEVSQNWLPLKKGKVKVCAHLPSDVWNYIFANTNYLIFQTYPPSVKIIWQKWALTIRNAKFRCCQT